MPARWLQFPSMRRYIHLCLLSMSLVSACNSASVPTNSAKIDYQGFYTADSTYAEQRVDSFKISSLIHNNTEFLEVGFVPILARMPHPPEDYTNGGNYKVIAYRRFQKTEHWIVQKTRNYRLFDITPYMGIFLLITDTSQRGRFALKLAEKSQVIHIVSSYDSASSKISSDNVVNKYEKHAIYSDVTINGKSNQFVTEISSIYKISTDTIQTLRSDTTTLILD